MSMYHQLCTWSIVIHTPISHDVCHYLFVMIQVYIPLLRHLFIQPNADNMAQNLEIIFKITANNTEAPWIISYHGKMDPKLSQKIHHLQGHFHRPDQQLLLKIEN